MTFNKNILSAHFSGVYILLACEGVDFAPLVFDTFGGWTPEVSHVISVISKCAAARSGERCGEVRSQVEQQLSLALTRCTAAMILAIEAC